jgi:Icc-related predicted phosphoesterase
MKLLLFSDLHCDAAAARHIHESWGRRERIGDTLVVNAGPRGVEVELG